MDKLTNFNQQFFKNNREQLKLSINQSVPIVITASGLIQRGADNSYPFAQDANFWYLSGINDPDIILVIDEDMEFLIVPIREGTRVTFDGQIDQDYLAEVSGISDFENEASGWKRLDSIVQKTRRVATLAPADSFIEQYGMYANPARSRLMDRLNRHIPELELIDIRSNLARLRTIKQQPEISAIQEAIDITTATLREILSSKPGVYGYEYQIESDITRGFRYRGAQGHAFDPIVAGGIRGCTLHNVANNAPIKPGEMVVLDVGASVEGYAADITRMYTSTSPTKRQLDVVNAVYEVQAYAMSLLRPGVRLKDYENKVAKFMGTKLKQLGLIKSSNLELVRQYFPHATSHFLGLNVHDVGDYQEPLQLGSVITVEPGIYIPDEAIGVRLEDDVLITTNGIINLSRKLPSRLNVD